MVTIWECPQPTLMEMVIQKLFQVLHGIKCGFISTVARDPQLVDLLFQGDGTQDKIYIADHVEQELVLM